MTIEVRVGDPEEIIAAYEDRWIRDAIVGDPLLRLLAPDVDLGAIDRNALDDDWEPRLVHGAFQEVDSLPSVAPRSLADILVRCGMGDVGESILTLRVFIVPEPGGTSMLGPIRLVSRSRMRECVEVVADAVAYRALGRRASDEYAIGDIPFSLEVLRHALDVAAPRHWIHLAG